MTMAVVGLCLIVVVQLVISLMQPVGGATSPGTCLPIDKGGTDCDPVASRSYLGLGSLATINSPLPLAQGGTGATTPYSALRALSPGPTDLTPPTHVVAFNSTSSTAGYRTVQGLRSDMGLGNTLGVLGLANGGTGQDTGSSTTITSYGMTIQLYKWGRMVYMTMQPSQTVNTYLPQYSVIATFPVGYRPVASTGMFMGLVSYGGSYGFQGFYIESDGRFGNMENINSGAGLNMTISYLSQ